MHAVLEYRKVHDAFIKSFDFELPALASDAYYRDEIGNVSTSNFRSGKLSSHLYLEPRYPLYGGWNYTWYQGYYVPLPSLLKQLNTDSTEHTLIVPLVDALPKSPILDFTFRLVLPEGATNVRIGSLPIINYEIEHGTLYSFLDILARPTITIHCNNVIKKHWGNIEIQYSYNSMNQFLKPFAAFATILLGIITWVILSRIDLSLSPSKQQKHK